MDRPLAEQLVEGPNRVLLHRGQHVGVQVQRDPAPLLADRGLPDAITSQARKSPVQVDIHADRVGRYPPDVEAAVYLCSLEALQNVAKYAHASRASIRLTQINGSLTFEVTDDGDGFDPTSIGYGTGLQGMADRLDAIGGTLEVRSAPGEGTAVTGRVPST